MIHPPPRSRAARLVAGIILFTASISPAWSAISYTRAQQDTIIELVDQLEERHYSKLPYDDSLSSQHLDAYINALDPGRLFFTTQDLAGFEKYRTTMDDALVKGDLRPAYVIFNRYQARLEERQARIVQNLPDYVAAMDFTVDESVSMDFDKRPWATSERELDERWRVQLKNQVLSLKLSDKPDDEIVPTLQKRYRNQLARVKQYNSQDVFQIYANALTELYDPHSNYLSPRGSENFNINMSLSLEGIGAVLQTEDEYTKVARLVPSGPADKQGELKPSDLIVGVGEGDSGEIEDVIGWRLDEVVELIRGPKDSTVRLEVIPAAAKSTDQRKLITITRSQVKLEEQSARKEVLEIPADDGDGVFRVGVIDIPAFYIDFEAMRRGDKNYKSTTRDVRKLLDELQAEKVDGVIIDLRSNGGGSLQEANELTGLFIEYGPTVQIRHSSRRVWRDGKRLKSPYYDGPMVVLVNRLSASASEIFAGAIQDYQRGVVVGDRSFGKGTVQTLIPLTEGQLKVTESKFYRISGESTQHRGVVPDVTFPTLYDPEEIGESTLDHALNWDKINPVRYERYTDLSTVVPVLNQLHRERSATNPDFVFLEEQAALARETRNTKVLPLNEKARIALRDEREARGLAIENKRRKALGEPLLDHLEEDSESDGENSDSPPLGQNDDDEDPADDPLLQEAGEILVDVLKLKAQRIAVHGEDKVAESH